MPNEFVARNGIIALNNSTVTGSLNVTNGITGSLLGTASYAVTASFALNGGSGGSGASFTLNQSSPSTTWTVNHGLANSYPVITVYDSNGFVLIPQNISSSNANQTIITFSYSASGYATAVVQGTTVTTASFASNAVSASFSSTASYVNPLNQPVIITGSLTVISGSAVELQVTNTGVNIGNIVTDVHTITGSLRVSGSITGSLLGTASLATTASFAVNAGASFPFTGSAQITGSLGVTGSVTATTLIETSALRYKQNIQNLENSDVIYKLRPVTFDWKSTQKPDVGFIAEEVNEIIPILAEINENGETEGVKYSKLTAILTKALQVHDQRLKNQQKEIDELKQEINVLKNK